MDESLTSRNLQPASIPIADQPRSFLARLAEDGNPALTRLVCAWLREPRGSADSAPACVWDVAVLRAEILATWPASAGHAPVLACESGPGRARSASNYAGRQPAGLACAGGGRQCR
jgi:hypothetical protein